MTPLRLTIIVLALLLVGVSLAFSQSPPPPCAPREQVLSHLTGEKYNEQAMIELNGTPTGTVLHLYGNLATGTWTFVGFPDAVTACVFGTGKHMKLLKPTIPGTPS